MTIFYEFDKKLYANITNKCPCSCVFCIRKNSDSVGENDSLWLEHEPDLDEITAAFDAFDKTGLSELVFCGYGEPMERAEMLVKTAEYVKKSTKMKIRVNTNGLVKRINPDFDISTLKGVIDSVSISLNAPDAVRYNEVTRPKYGLSAFETMLDFAEKMKDIVPQVIFTVVDIISKNEIAACQKLASDMNIPLRIRHHVTNNKDYT